MNMDDNDYVEFEEAKPEKDNRRTILIVAGALVLVCCCCVFLAYGLYNWWGDAIVQWLGF